MPTRPVRRSRAVRAPLAAVLSTVLSAALAGCGGNPPTVGPTGVDGLTVPTPSPAPKDFVVGVDHPLLPLSPDARWELTGAERDGDPVGLVLTTAGTERIAGTVSSGLRVSRPWPALNELGTWWFAESTAGDVWLLGADDPAGRPVFRAGEDGAEAGLVLAADSRVGDGYALWSVDGEPQAVAEVVATDEGLAVPWGLADGVVTLALDADLERDGPELRVALGEGVGPMEVEDLVTGGEVVLVARS